MTFLRIAHSSCLFCMIYITERFVFFFSFGRSQEDWTLYVVEGVFWFLELYILLEEVFLGAYIDKFPSI